MSARDELEEFVRAEGRGWKPPRRNQQEQH
jgi:hypothetical protein